MGFLKAIDKVFKASGTKAEMVVEDKIQAETKIRQAVKAAEENRTKTHAAAAKVVGAALQVQMQMASEAQKIADLTKNIQNGLQQRKTAEAKSDAPRVAQLTTALTSLAGQLQGLKDTNAATQTSYHQAQQAAEAARQADADAEMALQQTLADAKTLVGQAQQAELQETINKTMGDLYGSGSNKSVPTLDDVKQQLQARYANALGASQLDQANGAHAQFEITHAQKAIGAQSLLDEMEAQLELPVATAAAVLSAAPNLPAFDPTSIGS